MAAGPEVVLLAGEVPSAAATGLDGRWCMPDRSLAERLAGARVLVTGPSPWRVRRLRAVFAGAILALAAGGPDEVVALFAAGATQVVRPGAGPEEVAAYVCRLMRRGA